MPKLTVAHESWPIAGTFTISRGSKTAADVVVVTLEAGGAGAAASACPMPATARRWSVAATMAWRSRRRISAHRAGLGRDADGGPG
jgi:L-Ala-D/L-Glu epimerase